MTEPSAAARQPPGAGDAGRWRRVVGAVLSLGALVSLTGCGGGEEGAAEVTVPTTAPAAMAGAEPAMCAGPPGGVRRPLDGFGEVGFRVAGRDGSTFAGCALLADTPDARARGLMGQRDLRGYDAMVFRFDGPSTGAFYMFETVLPLSVAYVGADGAVVSVADMDPCQEEEASACPTYEAAGAYVHAVEVGQGDLQDLGIEPGAVVSFDDRPAS